MRSQFGTDAAGAGLHDAEQGGAHDRRRAVAASAMRSPLSRISISSRAAVPGQGLAQHRSAWGSRPGAVGEYHADPRSSARCARPPELPSVGLPIRMAIISPPGRPRPGDACLRPPHRLARSSPTFAADSSPAVRHKRTPSSVPRPFLETACMRPGHLTPVPDRRGHVCVDLPSASNRMTSGGGAGGGLS